MTVKWINDHNQAYNIAYRTHTTSSNEYRQIFTDICKCLQIFERERERDRKVIRRLTNKKTKQKQNKTTQIMVKRWNGSFCITPRSA